MIGGIRTWGATGALELDENSFTVRLAYTSLIQKAAGEDRTRFISIPGIAPSTHRAVCFPVNFYDPANQTYNNIQYIPIVSVGGVTVYFGQPGTNASAPNGIGLQRLMVMRYR